MIKKSDLEEDVVMYRREIDNLSHSAEVKIGLFNKSVPKYLTSAMLGSLFVSFRNYANLFYRWNNASF